MNIYTFIDAANISHGGISSLGWRIDYAKLLAYLKEKLQVSKTYYFGGIEIHNFSYDYSANSKINLELLENHLSALLKNKDMLRPKQRRIRESYRQCRFYRKLEALGYEMMLKPVKIYFDKSNGITRKANCDIDIVVQMIDEIDNYNSCILMSGDGDFLPILKFLSRRGKRVQVYSHISRTAKEILRYASKAFMDLNSIKDILKKE